MKTKIVINPEYEHLRPQIEAIAANDVPADARLVYKSRNRVYAVKADGVTLNVKAFRPASFPNKFVYTHLRLSKARRSYENALHLLTIGIDTPMPVAYIENTDGGALTTSYYISVQLDDCRDMRLWLQHPDAEAALPALARFLQRLHHKGVWHKDFSPGNILWRRDPEAPDGYRFFLIDLNRMEFDVFDRDKQLKNLSVIYIESEGETDHFARLYAEAAGLSPDDTAEDAIRLYHKYMSRKKMLRALKSSK